MYRLSHRNIGLLICCYRGSLILGIMHVYLTAHMREGISARPGVTGGVTGSGGTSNSTVRVRGSVGSCSYRWHTLYLVRSRWLPVGFI